MNQQRPRLLNTRPPPQGLALTAQLQACGFEVIEYCPITIEPISDFSTQPNARALALDLDEFSDIIVTSRFAARFGLEFLSDFWPQWPLLTWWAIGDSTAKKMQTFGINPLQPPAIIVAENPQKMPLANSETFLKALRTHWQTLTNQEIIPTQSLSNRKKVLVLAGKAGRGLIQTELKKQGIHVETLECYERVKNASRPDLQPMAGVILTSVDIADSLLIDQTVLEQLGPDCYFICASARIAEFVQRKGAMKVVNSASASNTILSETLEQLLF